MARTGSIVPVGPPPRRETLAELAARGVPISACGRCSIARGRTDEDLESCHAQFISPRIFADKVVAADRVVSL